MRAAGDPDILRRSRPYTGGVGSRSQRSLQWAAAAAAVIAILFLAFGLVAGSGR